MVSPLARGLFHRAIAQSLGATVAGPKPRLRVPHYGLPSAEAQGESIAPDIKTLRALSANEVLAQLPTDRWGVRYVPIIDGYVVPDDPAVLIGTTKAGESTAAHRPQRRRGSVLGERIAQDRLANIANLSARGFPQLSLTRCSHGIQQRPTPMWRSRRR